MACTLGLGRTDWTRLNWTKQKTAFDRLAFAICVLKVNFYMLKLLCTKIRYAIVSNKGHSILESRY